MAKLTKSPRLNQLLYQMGIYDEYGVISHFPRRYDDFSLTEETTFSHKQRVVIYGKIISIPKLVETKKVDVITFEFMSNKSKYFRVVAFNRRFLLKTLNINEDYTIIGIYNKNNNEIDLVNVVKGQISKENCLKPIYSLPKDYDNHLFISLVERSLNALEGKIHTSIPYDYLNKYKLVNKERAIKYAHKPTSYQEIKAAYRHLKYEEALHFSLKNLLIKEANKSLAKIKKEPIDLSLAEPFLSTLPYSLTNDQRKACEEIIEDMNQSSLMYRLLQGDVGTGKTLVSFIAIYANYLRGDQGALMAPTDSLARQHYKNALKLFENTKMKIKLLVGSTPSSEKQLIYQDLEDGSIDLIIGTHALFSKSVIYSSLGLVVIDEQHRFGVNQRMQLASKGEHADILMMSATPIPRSLALTLYGDLDISILSEFPNKIRNLKTLVLDSNSPRIFKAVDYSLEHKKQIYVVAPMIDFTPDGKYSVEQLFARFVLKYKEKVGLLHGKMKPNEKEEVLEKFYSGEINILVSTQVIEVGIDVKNANLMIIYDASNFGLASLHQLRGRIGRDGEEAFCILTHDDNDEEALNRLKVLTDTEDGFLIAEEDLKLRGPGELTGMRQSGLPNFRYLNPIDDLKIFISARDDAIEILNNKEKYKYLISYLEKKISSQDLIKG